MQICRKIRQLGCVTCALAHERLSQPSLHIFLHFCTLSVSVRMRTRQPPRVMFSNKRSGLFQARRRPGAQRQRNFPKWDGGRGRIPNLLFSRYTATVAARPTCACTDADGRGRNKKDWRMREDKKRERRRRRYEQQETLIWNSIRARRTE